MGKMRLHLHMNMVLDYPESTRGWRCYVFPLDRVPMTMPRSPNMHSHIFMGLVYCPREPGGSLGNSLNSTLANYGYNHISALTKIDYIKIIQFSIEKKHTDFVEISILVLANS